MFSQAGHSTSCDIMNIQLLTELDVHVNVDAMIWQTSISFIRHMGMQTSRHI